MEGEEPLGVFAEVVVQTVDPVDENVPAPQLLQTEAPAAEYLPAGQDAQL